MRLWKIHGRGFSLVEVLIGATLGVIVLMGMTTAMTFSSRTAKSISSTVEFNSLVTTIQGILNNSTNCATALSNVTFASTPVVAGPIAPALSILPFRTQGAGGSVIVPAGPLGNSLNVSNFEFNYATPLGTSQFVAALHLSVTTAIGGGAVGAQSLSHDFMVVVRLNGANTIVACSGLTDSLWQKAANGSDIYFDAGKVGIGTDTPNSKLTVSINTTGLPALPINAGAYMVHIVGGDDFSTRPGLLLDGFSGQSTYGPIFFGRAARGTAASPTAVKTDDALAVFGGAGYADTKYAQTAASIRIAASEDWTDAANGSQIIFKTTPNGATGGPFQIERMRIDSSGNVGIGTTSPADELQVVKEQQGVTSIGVDNADNVGDNSHTAFTASSGSLTNRFVQLSFANAGCNNSDLLRQPLTAALRSGSGATGGMVLATQANAPIIFATSGVNFPNERMRIDSSGNVGIGTTTPTAKLEVAGGIKPGAAMTGAACTPEGAFGYDNTAHSPVFCSNSLVWAPVGGAYTHSCIAGATTFNWPMCCRIATHTGAVDCKSYRLSPPSWNVMAAPFAATAAGLYGISCLSGNSTFSGPMCCRNNLQTGASECRNYVLGTDTWVNELSPF